MLTRNRNTVWVAGTAALALLMLVATYFLLVQPQRASASDLADQTQQVRDSNLAIQERTEQLKAQFATLGDEKQQLAADKASLPSSAELPQLLRQLDGYARTSGVTLTNVTPGSAEAFVADGAAAPAAASTAASTGATPASGVLALPLSLQVNGSFAQVELFVKNVQADMKRYYAVSTLDLQNGEGGVAATLTGKVFVMQEASASSTTVADAASAAPSGPSTTGVAN
ncbi:hypothetical protein ACFEMC_09040 [Kineococcus sp. DHX-1]|uniref:hypothetical protein n=1 Tax=Kineococcus sp. DHX-1 TaxID=3349638 RepID=UPI0036D35806